MTFEIIVACDLQNGGIGYKNRIPWTLPHDMRRFYTITTTTRSPSNRNAIIMGRKTWESIGSSLKGRMNIVVTSSHIAPTCAADICFVKSFDEALSVAYSQEDVETTFVIGGERLYEEAIDDSRCSKLHITFVKSPLLPITADAYFPIKKLKDNNLFKLHNRTPFYREKDLQYAFLTYVRK
jgi:dihydrofolate reductase/thymidylate synthase